jgi:dissimilatory sulfite reductase related protein
VPGGAFAFGRELARVAERVIEGYSPDDVRQLGDAVVGILDAVRAMTQPEALMIAAEASEVLQKADEAEPIGIVGMVRASRDAEVQKGLAVMLDLLRHVGRGAKAMADRRGGPAPEVRRPALAPRAVKKAEATAPAPKQACAAPGPAVREATVQIDGVGFAADGHLADPATWSPQLAEHIAAAEGVALGEPHWKVILFARGDFESAGVSPNVRRITQGAGVTTKELYALFPRAPARTVAKIAGIPKPAGCI